MKIFILAALFSSALCATVVDPSDCTSYPCLIFEDTFDFLDFDVWEPEITLSGGGNWEFQGYVNNRSTSFTKNGYLYIKPQLTSEWQTESFLSSGEWNLWGQNGRGDVCTANSYYGCDRVGNSQNILNPIMSARLRTLQDFAFTYGTVEVVAKMPRGQWLWPAVWLLPRYFKYGMWPSSGEIDIVESRGNDDYDTLGNQYAGTTLHWGPYYSLNQYALTTNSYQTATGERFTDNFHTWLMDWSPNGFTFSLDGQVVLTIDPGTSFWDFGNFASVGDIDNPWAAGGKMTPFDQDFYLIVNVAVGGTNGFFPDGVPSNPPKPWVNTSPTAFLDFWNGRDMWLPTWQDPDGKISDNAALQIDSIRITKTSAD